MKTITLLEPMTSCITDGSRVIPTGTVLVEHSKYLSWTYFKGDGFTLVLMGWTEDKSLERQGKLIINVN